MQYTAFLTKEGRDTLIEFPDAPGCQTFAGPRDNAYNTAREAIEGWLEAHLVADARRVPSAPKARHRAPNNVELMTVTVDPVLAAKVALRRARIARGLTQKQLAERLDVGQSRVAKLEHPDFPSTLSKLREAAEALGADVDINIELRDL